MTEESKHEHIKVPNVATDAIVLRPVAETDNKMHDILLITRKFDPFKGSLAYPGGFVDYNEDPQNACMRELREEAGASSSAP